MKSSAGPLGQELARLAGEGLLRQRRVLDSPQGPRVLLAGRTLLNFSSNDYLGLANHPRLRDAAHAALDAFGVGSGASPLVTGHSRLHEQAEERFARFCGLPRALLFASGYAANLGILAALGGRDAQVFCDRLDHACLYDGALLSRGELVRFPHLDLASLDRRLAESRAATRIVATDTVFSMDGDVAPVAELAALCERHDAWLVLDDAHGVGVLGARGHGALEHFGVASPRVVYMATLGKALGGYGAFVAGEAHTVEWLLQRARTYVFSTALPPMAAATAIAAMDLIDSDESPVGRLHERIAQFRAACRAHDLPVADSRTAIQPLVVGDAAAAVALSERLAERGFLVPAIRPPTVPQGTSRLRISVSAAHTRDDLEHLAQALAESLAP